MKHVCSYTETKFSEAADNNILLGNIIYIYYKCAVI